MLAMPPTHIPSQHQQHPFATTDSVASPVGKQPSVEIVSSPAALASDVASNTEGTRFANPGTDLSVGRTSTTGNPLTPGPTPPFPSSLSSSTFAQQYLQELKQEPPERKRLSKRFLPRVNRNSTVAPLQPKKPSSTSWSSLDRAAHKVQRQDKDRPQAAESAIDEKAHLHLHLPTRSAISLSSNPADKVDKPRDDNNSAGRLHARSVEGLPSKHTQPTVVQPSAQHNAAPAGNDREESNRDADKAAKAVDSGYASKTPSVTEDNTSVISGAGLVDAASDQKLKLDRKMHQTSSRLLRMTDDDRPFTRVSEKKIPSVLGH